jgi:phage tail protein X
MIAGFPIAGRPIAGSRLIDTFAIGEPIAAALTAAPALTVNVTSAAWIGCAMRARPRLLATLTGLAVRTVQQEDPDYVRARQDEVLDAMVWRVTGLASGAVESVLAANPGLANLGTHLPQGYPVFIPALAAVPSTARPLVQLWD